MRSHCSVYVDAGYLLASAATRVTGTSLRNGIHVEFARLVQALIAHAEEASGLPVLRVHWYDSAKDGVPDAQQQRIGELPRVKLRLGRFGVDGQQKGVDLRIGLDLVAHARNRAADAFYLVTGDDDLAEAVEEAQALGVQVVVVAVPNASGRPHGVNRHLVRAADDLDLLDPPLIDAAVLKVDLPPAAEAAPAAAPGEPAAAEPAAAPPVDAQTPTRPAVPVPSIPVPSPRDLAAKPRPGAAPAPSSTLAWSAASGGLSQPGAGYDDPADHDEEIDAVVTQVLESYRVSASPAELSNLRQGRPSIPRDIDRALLLDLSDRLGAYDLSDPVRFRLRDRFWRRWDELAG